MQSCRQRCATAPTAAGRPTHLWVRSFVSEFLCRSVNATWRCEVIGTGHMRAAALPERGAVGCGMDESATQHETPSACGNEQGSHVALCVALPQVPGGKQEVWDASCAWVHTLYCSEEAATAAGYKPPPVSRLLVSSDVGPKRCANCSCSDAAPSHTASRCPAL